MKSILDPSFKYVSSTSTDLRKTFARIRREQQKVKAEQEAKVQPIQQAKERKMNDATS